MICVGSINTDILLLGGDLPQRGSESYFSSCRVLAGGSAANTAAALKRLTKLMPTKLLACVGKDSIGSELLRESSREGVDVSEVVSISGVASGLTCVVVASDGERTMFTCEGASAMLNEDTLVRWERSIERASWIHFANVEAPNAVNLYTRLAKTCKDLEITTSLDPGDSLARRGYGSLRKLLSAIDFLLCNEHEFALIVGQFSPSLLTQFNRTVRTLVKTHHGAFFCTIDEPVYVGGFDVQPLDNTGRDDAWNAGFIYGKLRGFSEQHSIMLANANSAFCSLRAGARNGATLGELARFIQQNCKTSSSALLAEIESA